jgi:hypothetical protein
MKLELSSRYYIAEISVWLLSATLAVAYFVGVVPSQPLPLLNLTLVKQQDFARVVAVLIVLVSLYMIFEWEQSDQRARHFYGSKIRFILTALVAGVSLWLSYPLIVINTIFAGISPAWYLGFLLIGFFLGAVMSILAFASLMIRSPAESRTLRLPRVPKATRAQYVVWIPAGLLLLTAYYVFFYYSADAVKRIGPFLVSIPFLLMVVRGHASLCLHHDSNGQRILYAKRIARFKEIHDFHDYFYMLNDCGAKVVEGLNVDVKAAPHLIQAAIRKNYAVEPFAEDARFTAQTLDEIEFQFYLKDGDKKNQTLENRGVRIRKPKVNGDYLKVRVILENSEREPIELDILIKVVEKYADAFILTQQDGAKTVDQIISYAINQAVIETMVEQAGPLLHRLVETGDEEKVAELLKQDVNVNERAEYGWTALLYAAAQGYPKIVRSLLDAGANPDIGNVHDVTPLMFGARYGNIDVCNTLLEYGANIDLKDVYGMTALISATNTGNAEVVDILLRAGANRVIKDREGMTALDYAYKLKQGNIAKYLRAKNK